MICPRCGTDVGPRSCNACLRAWNGNGAWLKGYWKRYWGNELELIEPEVLVHVDAPHFSAGVILHGDRVVRAAPILKWSMGWSRERLSAYCKRKGWRAFTLAARAARSAR